MEFKNTMVVEIEIAFVKKFFFRRFFKFTSFT